MSGVMTSAKPSYLTSPRPEEASPADQSLNAEIQDPGLRKRENEIKDCIRRNFKSTRKAFMGINFDAKRNYVELKQIANFFENHFHYDSKERIQEDLRAIITERGIKLDGDKLSYESFRAWVSPVLEPHEEFMFRHDTSGNPKFVEHQQKIDMGGKQDPNYLFKISSISHKQSPNKTR